MPDDLKDTTQKPTLGSRIQHAAAVALASLATVGAISFFFIHENREGQAPEPDQKSAKAPVKPSAPLSAKVEQKKTIVYEKSKKTLPNSPENIKKLEREYERRTAASFDNARESGLLESVLAVTGHMAKTKAEKRALYSDVMALLVFESSGGKHLQGRNKNGTPSSYFGVLQYGPDTLYWTLDMFKDGLIDCLKETRPDIAQRTADLLACMSYENKDLAVDQNKYEGYQKKYKIRNQTAKQEILALRGIADVNIYLTVRRVQMDLSKLLCEDEVKGFSPVACAALETYGASAFGRMVHNFGLGNTRTFTQKDSKALLQDVLSPYTASVNGWYGLTVGDLLSHMTLTFEVSKEKALACLDGYEKQQQVLAEKRIRAEKEAQAKALAAAKAQEQAKAKTAVAAKDKKPEGAKVVAEKSKKDTKTAAKAITQPSAKASPAQFAAAKAQAGKDQVKKAPAQKVGNASVRPAAPASKGGQQIRLARN